MPYLAGDKSMKVKLKCPCVRALKGKVVSLLPELVQASAPHSSLAPAHYNGHPRVLTLTSGLGKVECGERGAVPATALFGHNMWTGQRDWGQAGMSCVHCYL